MKELAGNVKDFLVKRSHDIGRYESENFYSNIENEFYDLDICSPIEQLLYCSLVSVSRFNFLERSDIVYSEEGKEIPIGLGIFPQYKVGKYRCDFLVGFYKHNNDHNKEVIVECDSQQFHERTEKERRYEKQRDRFLISKGYVVMHFTGSEIVQNPDKVSIEIINAVTKLHLDTAELCLEGYGDIK